jgi:hypothetical protein
MRLAASAIAVCTVFSALPLCSQGPPSRDFASGAPKPRTATTLVRGRVLIAGTDVPVRKARVTLGSQIAAGGEVVYSDAEGRFEFPAVPPGRYVVAAWKTGYVETKFGARSFWDRPVAIAATPGTPVDGIQIGLVRGASISGRVVDAFGDPLSHRPVTVGRVLAMDGSPRFEQIGATDTDDLGEYRVGGLPAGTFVVAVSGRTGLAPAALARAQIADERTFGSGPMRFGSLFYPQSPFLTEAQPLTLRAGEDSSGVDITFSATEVHVPRVSGRILDPTGRSTGFSFSANSDGGGLPEAAMGMMTGVPQTGEFAVALQPGGYMLVAEGEGGTAMLHIKVDRADVDGLQLVLARNARVSGRVVFDGTASRPPGRMSMQAVSRELVSGMPLGPAAAISPTGTFTLSNVVGTRELRVINPPPGWGVKSITSGGRNVLDIPIEFKGGEDLQDVVVVLSDRLSELSGTVTDSEKRLALGVSIVVFADDRRQLPRRAHWVRPDNTGRFAVADLAAGNYLVALVEEVDDARWFTVEYLDRLREGAARVTIGDGETKTIGLQWNGS